jgi:uncharacterized protein (DUF934 family)
MRQIIRRREIVGDELRYAGEPAASGTVGVHTASEWIAAAVAGSAPAPGALLLTAADEVEALADHLAPLHWIVIDFAKIGEGRGFSQARLLRQRYRYAHELRARGAIKRDQLFFLARCGFDAFDLDPAEDLVSALGALGTFSVAYQDGSDTLVHVRRRLPDAAA